MESHIHVRCTVIVIVVMRLSAATASAWESDTFNAHEEGLVNIPEAKIALGLW